MAIGRVLGRLARASPAERRMLWPRLCRLRSDAMAAAAARGQEGRACAMARLHAVRAEAEASSRDIMACAQARAWAAQATLRRCQRQAGSAAEAAAVRFRRAHDRTLSSILYIAYGESAPQTPSPAEVLEYLLMLRDKAQRIHSIWQRLNDLIEKFRQMDPVLMAMILSFIDPVLEFLAPMIEMIQSVIEMVQSWVSCAPEYVCPFLGVEGLPFDVFPVEEGLIGVACLAGSCAGVMVIVLAGLCGCLILDIHEMFAKTCKHLIEYCKKPTQTSRVAAAPGADTGSRFELKTFDGDFDQATLFDGHINLAENYLDIKELLDLACQTVANMTKGKAPEEIHKTFNIKNDFSKEEDVQMKELVDLTCQMVAFVMKRKTADEIRKTFNIKNNLTPDDDLDIQELLDLTCKTVADMIKGKSPEEIRKTFNIKNDFTKEEEDEIRRENQWAFE